MAELNMIDPVIKQKEGRELDQRAMARIKDAEERGRVVPSYKEAILMELKERPGSYQQYTGITTSKSYEMPPVKNKPKGDPRTTPHPLEDGKGMRQISQAWQEALDKTWTDIKRPPGYTDQGWKARIEEQAQKNNKLLYRCYISSDTISEQDFIDLTQMGVFG